MAGVQEKRRQTSHTWKNELGCRVGKDANSSLCAVRKQAKAGNTVPGFKCLDSMHDSAFLAV